MQKQSESTNVFNNFDPAKKQLSTEKVFIVFEERSRYEYNSYFPSEGGEAYYMVADSVYTFVTQTELPQYLLKLQKDKVNYRISVFNPVTAKLTTSVNIDLFQ